MPFARTPGGDEIAIGMGMRVRHCPFCLWSLTTVGVEEFDYAGVECAIEDHLNDYHPGWTLDGLFAKVRGESS